MIDKIERLRKLQLECSSTVDDIVGSLESKCDNEALLELVENVLDLAYEFPDSDTVQRVLSEIVSKKESSHKKDKKKHRKEHDS